MRSLTPSSLLPANEAERLRSLRDYNILQSPPERVFSEFVALSAQVFGLPAALLALVDAHEVVYKATHGLPGLRTSPRAQTFCALAIQQNEPVIFCDVAQAAHPCMTELALKTVLGAGVHFYAGALLRMPDAQTIGTLCVLGCKPRPFGAGEQHLLEQLAHVLSLSIAVRHTCLTSPGLGIAHWEVLEDQLAEEVQALSASAGQPALALPLVQTQVEGRLHDLRELLQEYQPAAPEA